jgi:hypothetical protein
VEKQQTAVIEQTAEVAVAEAVEKVGKVPVTWNGTEQESIRTTRDRLGRSWEFHRQRLAQLQGKIAGLQARCNHPRKVEYGEKESGDWYCSDCGFSPPKQEKGEAA